MTARFKLEGIYTPVITPFDDAGEIDFGSLADLVERLVSAGVHGLISGGSTGENYAETVEERIEEVNRGLPEGVRFIRKPFDRSVLLPMLEDLKQQPPWRQDEQALTAGR